MQKKYDVKLIGLAAMSVIFLIMILLFIVKPSITGYGIYQEAKSMNVSIKELSSDIGDLRDQILVKSTNLSNCNDNYQKIEDRLEECISSLDIEKENNIRLEFESKSSKELLRRDLDDCEDDFSSSKEELEDELKSLEKEYAELLKNSARVICCKKKVDNPKIAFYDIESNHIVCRENFGKDLKC